MAFFTHKVSEKTSILYRKLIKMKRLTKPNTKKYTKTIRNNCKKIGKMIFAL